eukprot:TRINITY_DN9820_c0_g1_i1.p1 TRINITY_DN9820_c0_g1~~TRINITY_DN9820_c0_g1_i1.p1  ORF type:complete len:167 (+),score=29.99 TRINITY_DN9820_c0_g1_i1:59-502(+)
MKIAVVSDELYPVNEYVVQWLHEQNHTTELFGALQTGSDANFVHAAKAGAEAVTSGDCDEGIFFCWTGTGISIAANKVKGIRAALCFDAATAKGARIWNHANVLALSNRQLSNDVAREILEAWFDPYDTEKGKEGVGCLIELDEERY